jgi:hypothetical protein
VGHNDESSVFLSTVNSISECSIDRRRQGEMHLKSGCNSLRARIKLEPAESNATVSKPANIEQLIVGTKLLSYS